MKTRNVVLLCVLCVVCGWFGARRHFGQAAAVEVAEARGRVDSLGAVLQVRESQLVEQQVVIDSTSLLARRAVLVAEAIPAPLRPLEPVTSGDTPPEVELGPWVEYADSLEFKLDVEIVARVAVEYENEVLGKQVILLYSMVETWKERFLAEQAVSQNLAKQLVTATKPSPWYWNNLTKPIYGVAVGITMNRIFN